MAIKLLQRAGDVGFFVKATAMDMAVNNLAGCLNVAMHLSAGVLLMVENVVWDAEVCTKTNRALSGDQGKSPRHFFQNQFFEHKMW